MFILPCLIDLTSVPVRAIPASMVSSIKYSCLAFLFVQLENTVEGLIHFSNMKDDYYNFDEENYYIIGERTKKIYRLGDVVKIEVVGADPLRRNIDFSIID